MFNESKEKNISFINIFGLFFFLFSRTIILIPENHFGLSISLLQFNLSLEAVLFAVLLIIYSLLLSYVVNVIYNKAQKTMLPLVFLVLFDCVFFALIDDCLKLIVVILGLLCVFNALSKKKMIKNSISFPAFIFISMVLDPRFLFSFVSLAFIIYLTCNADNKSKKKSRTLLISFACVLAGVAVNWLFTENFEVVDIFLDKLSFTYVLPTYKNWKTFASFVPMMIIGCVLYDKILKANKKVPSKMKSELVSLSADLIGIGYFLALAGFLIFESEAFMTMNLILPVTLITCTLKNEAVVINEISAAVEKINKHKILALFIAIIIFYWCFGFMDGYNDGDKIVNYIRY